MLEDTRRTQPFVKDRYCKPSKRKTHLHVSYIYLYFHSYHNLIICPLVFSVTSASLLDVRQAIEGAHETFKSGIWSKSPAISRSTVLSRLARNLERKIPELAKIESLQTGRALREMNAQLGRLPEWL